MDAISSSDYMPATSSAPSASPAAVGPIRQVAVPPTQQATVGPSTSRTEEASAESTQVQDLSRNCFYIRVGSGFERNIMSSVGLENLFLLVSLLQYCN